MLTKLLHRRGWSWLLSAAVALGAAYAMIAPANAQTGRPPANAPRGGQVYLPEPGYLGFSFLQIPDVSGDWRGQDHRGWVRIDGHYWQGQSQSFAATFRTSAVAPVPGAPRSGEGTLVLAIDKHNPSLPALMERCRSGATISETRYSVSTLRSNRTGLRAPLPPGMPDYFEFKLSGVQFADCPVVDAAPEQAIVVHFANIEWLNWSNEPSSVPIALEPAELTPLPRNLSGATRAWVLTWFALANDVSDDQCPTMNEKPTEADYYALMPAEEAARERVALAGQGGPSYENGQMGLRGPHRLNVTLLPGIVPDPGQAEPQTRIAQGLNLDGRNGGHHRNYVSADGAIRGIDNQLYTVMGCNAGWQGRQGFMFQYNMEAMRNGQVSALIEVSGIDDEQNDREVYVTVLYSLDDIAKSGSGRTILPNYTFRVADAPEYTHYFSRVRAQIIDGVIITEPVDDFRLNLGRLASPRPPGAGLTDARMRLQIRPDGTIRGVLAGYVDWRQIVTMQASSIAEFSQGFQSPALYNSLRRNADGMRDPVTGEYDGISAAYDLEGVPAFVVTTPANVS